MRRWLRHVVHNQNCVLDFETQVSVCFCRLLFRVRFKNFSKSDSLGELSRLVLIVQFDDEDCLQN